MPVWQAGVVLSLAALLLAVQSLSLPAAIWTSLGLFLLGVPHGAVERHPVTDPAHARTPALRRLVPTAGYTALYLVVALVIFCGWVIDPRLTLAAFLAVSAWHFSASEPRLRTVGAWVVLGSLLALTRPTLDVFSLITARELSTPALMEVGRITALCAGAALAAEAVWRHDLPYAALLVGMFALLHPVCAVALYYFGIHSLREWREVHAQTRERDARPLAAMLRLYAPFSLPVLAGGAGIIALVARGDVSLWIATGLAVAIATPHMLPFERWVAASRAEDGKPRMAAH